MKRSILLFSSILFLATTLSAQETEVRPLGDFDGVSVSASVDAILIKGNKNEVSITVKGIEPEKVRTEIKNGVLNVGMRNSEGNWSWGWGRKAAVDVKITYTGKLNQISVSSSADLGSEGVVKGDKMNITCSSSSDLTLEIEASEVAITASSSADVEISGAADHADITASSSADIEASDLKVASANITASSSADISISVSKSLKASASSSADIVYYGNPSVKDINRSSGADVSRGGGF